jgi:small conductance mechanosensitive channel
MTMRLLATTIGQRLYEMVPLAGWTIVLLLTLLLAFAGIVIAQWSKGRIVRMMSRTPVGGNVTVLAGNIVFLLVLLVTLLFIFRLYGLDATALVAILSIGTVAVGLALQDVLRNVFAGVYLLIEQPFRIGDTIVADGREGEVESIEVRTTVLRMADGTQALVPNAVVLATTVMNRTAYPTRRVVVQIAGLTDDLESVQHAVDMALAGKPYLAEMPGPRVHLESIVDGKATAIVELWRRADRDLSPSVLPALQAAFPDANVVLQSAGPTAAAARPPAVTT